MLTFNNVILYKTRHIFFASGGIDVFGRLFLEIIVWIGYANGIEARYCLGNKALLFIVFFISIKGCGPKIC